MSESGHFRRHDASSNDGRSTPGSGKPNQLGSGSAVFSRKPSAAAGGRPLGKGANPLIPFAESREYPSRRDKGSDCHPSKSTMKPERRTTPSRASATSRSTRGTSTPTRLPRHL